VDQPSFGITIDFNSVACGKKLIKMGAKNTKTNDNVIVNENVNVGATVPGNVPEIMSKTEFIIMAVIVSAVVCVTIKYVYYKCKKELEKIIESYTVNRVQKGPLKQFRTKKSEV
jgi:hypothetical protein